MVDLRTELVSFAYFRTYLGVLQFCDSEHVFKLAAALPGRTPLTPRGAAKAQGPLFATGTAAAAGGARLRTASREAATFDLFCYFSNSEHF